MGGSKLGKIIKYIALIGGIIFATFPYFYLIVQSLAPWNEVNRVIIPSKLTLKSYIWLFSGGGVSGFTLPWFRSFLNSLFVSSSSTLLMVSSAAIAGYALSKLRFKGSNTIYSFILFHMFYPSIVLIIPTFLIIKFMGLINNYGAMILPRAVSAWAIFMYYNFYKTIPQEVIDAARVDGASEFKIIFKVVLPMSMSITTVVFLFLFMARWDELLWDLIVVKDYNMMTLNVLLASMKGPYTEYPGALYAGAALLTLPLVLIFLIFSRNFAKGFKFIFK